MAERLKAHAWKACVRESVPWVRIPLSPPEKSYTALKYQDFPEIAVDRPTIQPTNRNRIERDAAGRFRQGAAGAPEHTGWCVPSEGAARTWRLLLLRSGCLSPPRSLLRSYGAEGR